MDREPSSLMLRRQRGCPCARPGPMRAREAMGPPPFVSFSCQAVRFVFVFVFALCTLAPPQSARVLTRGSLPLGCAQAVLPFENNGYFGKRCSQRTRDCRRCAWVWAVASFTADSLDCIFARLAEGPPDGTGRRAVQCFPARAPISGVRRLRRVFVGDAVLRRAAARIRRIAAGHRGRRWRGAWQWQWQ